MMFLTVRELFFAGVSLMLISSTVYGYTSNHRLAAGDGGSDSSEERREGCEEGWLLTHDVCLLYTGLEEDQAEEFCHQQDAQQTRGVCVKKPLSSEASALESALDREDVKTEAPPGSSDAVYQCPAGWDQYQDYCFFKPGAARKICTLLGASYLFNYCVTRVPHQISTDFMQAVKRLDGGDYDMHRDTRLCCCAGGGYCK